MRWQQAARIGVAVVGLGVAVAIFVLTRREPPAEKPVELATLDPNAALEGGPGRTLRCDGPRCFEIVFKGTRRYDDGRMRFEGAEVAGLDENKSRLRADVVETSGASASGGLANRYDMTGHVVLHTDDGLVVETERAHYDDGRGQVTMPDVMTFKRGRMSGGGVGAVYDRALGTVTIQRDATAQVAPGADGRGAANASAQRMIFMRGQHSLRLEEDARIVGDTETLTGQAATFSFTDDESAIKYLELRGGARVVPAAGTASASRPSMSADDITMSFHPDGLTLQHATLTGRAVLTLAEAGGARSIRASWIDMFLAADGQTLTGLQARDRVVVELPADTSTPARTITSATLSAKGEAKRGLTSARFEGSPKFEEVARGRPKAGGASASKRTGTATTLLMTLGGRLDAIEKAEFQQNAKFESGDMTAWADLATYDDARDVLLLVPNAREPRRLSRVTSPDMTVDASAIDLFLESQDLNARGEVTTRSSGGGAGKASATSSALFDEKTPIYGSAETLQYRQSSGTAIYVGSTRAQARLKQGETEVIGNRVEFAEATSNLTAAGNVDSTMQMAGTGDAAGQLQSYRVRADNFSYDEAARVAVYKGPLVVMTTSEGDIESRVLTLQLAAASRTLDRMRAEGLETPVYGRLSGNYEVVGDVLVYESATETYTLNGKPAKVKAPEEAESPGSGCKLSTSLVLTLNRKSGSVQVPGRGQAPRTTEVVRCDVSIRPGGK